jgi:biotin transport system substrate-specific component
MQTALTRSNTHILSGFASSIPGKIIFGLAATAIVAAAAHAVVPLPFTPVPFILTPLAVLGVGLAFGPVAGFLVMLTYLVEGAMGLPVFSPTGPGGIAQLLGPTGGFLMSYPLVALLAGGVTRGLTPRLPRFTAATIGGTIATAVLFLCGATWLSVIAHLSLHQTWIAAVGPFLPGEAIKVLCAAGIFSALTRTSRI